MVYVLDYFSYLTVFIQEEIAPKNNTEQHVKCTSSLAVSGHYENTSRHKKEEHRIIFECWHTWCASDVLAELCKLQVEDRHIVDEFNDVTNLPGSDQSSVICAIHHPESLLGNTENEFCRSDSCATDTFASAEKQIGAGADVGCLQT